MHSYVPVETVPTEAMIQLQAIIGSLCMKLRTEAPKLILAVCNERPRSSVLSKVTPCTEFIPVSTGGAFQPRELFSQNRFFNSMLNHSRMCVSEAVSIHALCKSR